MASVEDALAATLKRLRESSGLSQSEVAETLGTKQPVVARWEKVKANGGATPSPSNLNNVSALYGTTPAAVYEAVSDVAQTNVPDKVRVRAERLGREINERQKR